MCLKVLIYTQGVNIDEMYISHIYNSQKGYVRFPFINWKQWDIVKKKKYDKFVFKKYKKIIDK